MARRLLLVISFLLIALIAANRLVRAQQPTTPSEPPPPAQSDAPPPSYQTPPAITVVDGTARLSRQGQAQAAVANMPLVEGDRLTTEAGRIEVTFPDGSLLHLDQNTTVDFLSLSLMRLLDGRVILVAAGRGGERPAVDYQVDAPAGSVRVQAVGQYRVSTYSGEVELDVITGTAALATDQGSVQVDAGERSFAREGGAPGDPEAFNSARLDAFDQWSEAQRDADIGTQSAQYLPSDLSTYSSTFDRDGRWENVEPYGNVWYPTVSVGWRPYYNGYWDDVGPYGWTWIGYDRWAWPTHHFGRWGARSGQWFWIPGRQWGPAWVSWAYSPGYMSWCPLDFYNRPLMSLFFGNGVGFGHRGAFFDPWSCWTVLPRQRFGIGVRVAQYAVPGGRLTATARNEFVVRRGGPAAPFAGGRRAGGGMGAATPRALPTVPMQGRPRDSVFASPRASRATSRGVTPGGQASISARRDARTLPYSTAPSQRGIDRPAGAGGRQSVAPGFSGATPRGSARQIAPSEYRPPASSRVGPRGFDRPAAPTPAQPRGSRSSPSPLRGPASSAPRDIGPARPRSDISSAPRDMAPARPRGDMYSAPRYSAPSSPRYSAPSAPRYSAPSAPRYSAPSSPRYSAPSSPRYSAPSSPRYSAPSSPRYSAPSAPRYSAPSSPRYSAPSSPRYSAPSSPRYSAPSSPRYSAPSSPRYSAPAYSAPRAMPSGPAGPRSGGMAAPRSAPSAPSSRSTPSGGSGRGGSRGRPR
jgi:hypothetical protein